MMSESVMSKEPAAADLAAYRRAYEGGLDLSKLLGLFLYFLKHTPEGRQARRELEADWAKTVATLHERGQLRGASWSCSHWLKQVRNQLLANTASQTRPSSVRKKPVGQKHLSGSAQTAVKKGLRFKGV